jgi:hypothetical protein
MGAFSVFTGAVYLLVPLSLEQATPPRDRLREYFAFVIYDFFTI